MSTKKTSLAELPASGASPDDGLFWENRVADSLGVSRDRLRQFRKDHMTENVHYIRRGNAVVLTETGMRLATDRLAPPASEPTAEEQLPSYEKITAEPAPLAPSPFPAVEVAPFAPPAGPAPRIEVRVVKVPPNPRLLFCVPAGPIVATAAQCLVRVKTNENFMAGMSFEVISAGEGIWQYIGRLPRRKGRW
jgi:hypothetical protein